MAVAQGSCPGCGAPIEFGVGSSVSKVCDYCRATVLRSDRGLENLGRIADIANTPSLIAVGDQGTLSGRPFTVMGRVQLDHGAGPWDEYYVAFDYGTAWGWLAFAQGNWYVTAQTSAVPIPPYEALRLEMDLPLGASGTLRVGELKQGAISSAEGELPGVFRPGQVRYYADCFGQRGAFATLDYGDRSGPPELFIGWVFPEAEMQVTAAGPRTVQKVATDRIRCPSCGGDIPKLSGERALRVGCPFCGAVSDIAAQTVISTQEAARSRPEIPIGSRGVFDGTEYVCTATMTRMAEVEGELFSWDEYLLFSQGIGYRWLVKDEGNWSWVVEVNIAELDLSRMPRLVTWNGQSFTARNRNEAIVDYVLGEVYWKVTVGDVTSVMDFVNGTDVLSREGSEGEVHWSFSRQLPWSVIAQGFGLPLDSPAGASETASKGSSASGCSTVLVVVVIIIVVLILCAALGTCGSGGSSGSSRGGSGVFTGGK